MNTGGGTNTNTVDVGSTAPSSGGVVNGIAGALTVTGNGHDTLNVDDTGSSSTKTGAVSGTTLTGLAMGSSGILYSGLSNLNVNLGSGGNTFTVSNTAGGTTTTLNSGTGSDTVYVDATSSPTTVNTGGGTNANTVDIGSEQPMTGGVVDNIQGALTVAGDNSDTLNVDDTGSAATKAGTLTATALTGLKMGSNGISYSGLAYLNINLGSGGNTFLVSNTNSGTTTVLNSGTGADTVNVEATGGRTTVNTGGGTNTNTVNIGSQEPTVGGILDNIQGALTITGNQSDTLNVDDTGSTGQKTGTLTPTTLTGLNMGNGGITYSGLANLNINLGFGGSTIPQSSVGNTFTINDISSSTHTSVDGGVSNNDTVYYNAAADFTGKLDLTSFEHGTVKVTGNFSGAMTDTSPGHLELVLIVNSMSNSGIVVAVSIDSMTVGGNLAGTVQVQQALTNLAVTGDVSGSVSETLTINSLTIGGSLTSPGSITAVNTTASLGNINTLTIGQNLAGTVTVSGALTTGSVSGDVSGSISETLTINSLTIGGSLTSTGSITAVNTTTSLGNINTLTIGQNLAGTVTVSGALTTGSVSGDVSGTIQETLTVNTLYVGGSLTQTGLISAVNAADNSANPPTPALGNINTLTIGHDFAGTIIVSGTLGTFNLGGSMANTASLTLGNLNSFTIHGDMAGRLNITHTLGMLTVGGGTPGTVTAGQIGTISVSAGYGPLVAQIQENGIQRRIEAAVPSAPFPTPPPPPSPTPAVSPTGITFQYFYEGLDSPTIEGVSSTNLANPQFSARVINSTGSTSPDQFDFSLVTYSDTAKFNLVRLDTPTVGLSGNTTKNSTIVSGFTSTSPLVVGQAVSGAGIPAGTTIVSISPTSITLSNAATATASGVALTFATASRIRNIAVEGDLLTSTILNGNTTKNSTTVSGLSSTTQLAVGQIVTGAGIPAGTTIASIPSGGTSVVLSNAATATANNVSLTLPIVTPAAQNFFSLASPTGGIILPSDALAGVGIRDYAANNTIQASSIQTLAVGSLSRNNGQIETGAAANGNDVAALLASGTTIVQAGSSNGTTVETFRVPFADLSMQQVGFFMDDNSGGNQFDNNSIQLVVQSVSTANSSGTGNNVTQSNGARGAVIALITVAETFDQNAHLQNSILESISLRGDGGSIQTQQQFGSSNNNQQPKVAFTPSITSTGPLGDVTIQGSLPNVTAPSIFGSLLPNGSIPATSTIQTTGIRTDPITSATSQVSADLGRVYVTYTNKGVPVLTTTLVQSNGGPGLAGQILTGGNLISSVVASGGISGIITTQGNLGSIFTYPFPSTAFTLLGGATSNGPMDGPVLSPGNNNYTTLNSGALQGGTVTTFGNVYGNIAVNGPMVGPVISAGNNQNGTITVNGVVQGGYIITHGSLVGNISINGPMSGPVISTGNNQYGTINVNSSILGGFITTYGSVSGTINIGGPVNGPVVSAGNNQYGTINVSALVQGGSITTYGSATGTITINGPLNAPTISAGNKNGTLNVNVPVQGGVLLTDGTLGNLTIGGPLNGQVVTIGDMLGTVTINGPVQGVIATNGSINGNLTIGGPLSGDLLVVGNINGNVTINGPLQSGRIADLGSILGNLTINGGIDSQSAVVVGGSIGSKSAGTGLTVGNVNGILASVGSMNVIKMGSTNTALDYQQNDTMDAAVIDSIFSNAVTPLSGGDLFDETGALDLNNLAQILLNLNSLTVNKGKLML